MGDKCSARFNIFITKIAGADLEMHQPPSPSRGGETQQCTKEEQGGCTEQTPYGVNWHHFLESNLTKCFKIHKEDHVYDWKILYLVIFTKWRLYRGENTVRTSMPHERATVATVRG